MGKNKTVWYCAECGHKQAKWAGQCPACSKWNTLQEEVEIDALPPRFAAQTCTSAAKPLRLKEINLTDTPRILTHMGECDRLIGGGIVPSYFVVNVAYDKINQQRDIEFINLNDILDLSIEYISNHGGITSQLFQIMGD